MHRLWKLLTIFLFAPVFLFLAGCKESGSSEKGTELVMFCAAGMKAPVSRIAEEYGKEHGVNVQLQFGGSGTLLSNLQIAPADIYLAADASYTTEARKRGLVDQTYPVAVMKAGLGVPKGNPKKLSTLADVRKEGIRAGIGNPDAASIGKFSKKVLSQNGLWDGFKPAVVFPTVNELANAIKLGTVDVVILWDAVASQYPEVDFISVPEFDSEKKAITVAVTTASKHAAEADDFCRYLADIEKGGVIFREEGYVVPGKD